LTSRRSNFKSCFQCVALHSCFPFKKLEREEAREIAASCKKPYKGITTDIIEVEGQTRGMSRKKAFKLTQEGKGRWIGKDKISLS